MYRKIASLLLVTLALFSFVSCASQTLNETTESSGRPSIHITTVSSMPSIDVSWDQSYSNIDDLVSDSFVDLIVVGMIDRVVEITKTKEAETSQGPVYVYFTDFNFRIESVLKGTDRKEIVIHQTGAESGGQINEDPLFGPGERYLLFLHEFAPGKSFVVGGPEGRYRIIDGKVFSMNYLLPPKTYFVNEGLDINGVLEGGFIESIVSKVSSAN